MRSITRPCTLSELSDHRWRTGAAERAHRRPALSGRRYPRRAASGHLAWPAYKALLAAATNPAIVDPACARCESLHDCRTRCMSRSRLTTGAFWGKDPRCPGSEALTLPEAGGHGFLA